MPGVLTWKQVGMRRVRGCSLCGWVSPIAWEESASPPERRDLLQRIKAAFKAHACSGPPKEESPNEDYRFSLAAAPLDRTILGTESGYWQVQVKSAHKSEAGYLLLTLQLKRDVDGVKDEIRRLQLQVPLADLEHPLWRTRLSEKVRAWIESSCGNGALRVTMTQ